MTKMTQYTETLAQVRAFIERCRVANAASPDDRPYDIDRMTDTEAYAYRLGMAHAYEHALSLLAEGRVSDERVTQ